MSNSTDLAASIRASIVAQKDEITKIVGEITPEAIDNLEEELGGVATTVKSYHFKGGRENGHLAAIVSEDDYREIIEDEEWEYVEPEDQEEYDPDAVACTVAQRAVREAKWKRKATSLVTFGGVCEGTKDLIIYAVGEDAVVSLKQRFVKYGKVSPKQMIKHLRDKTCVKMTTLEKDRFKRQGYEAEWDVTKNIAVYWKLLDDHTIHLKNRKIKTSDEEKVTAAVARMWESGFFTEEALIKWEKRDSDDQEWDDVQEYFGELYHDHKQFSKATAKKARFDERMNHVKTQPQEVAQSEDAAMMFAMMQEQHSEQMNQMREQNKAALEMAQQSMREMAAMMKTMGGNRGKSDENAEEVDKENKPPNKPPRDRNKRPGDKRSNLGPKKEMFSWANRKVCKNCNQLVQHFDKDCFELEANAKDRPPNWTSRK